MSSKQSSHSWSLLTDYHGLPLHRYRYQLESFVDKVKGRQPRTWLDGEDSVANMEWIERIYEKVSLSSPSDLHQRGAAIIRAFATDWSWEST